jgi:hypothetical protein
LKEDGRTKIFKHTEYFRENYSNVTQKELEFIIQEGVFSYEYPDNFKKLKGTQLPPIKAFYSSIKKSGTNEEDYQRAQKVWNILNCKILKV